MIDARHLRRLLLLSAALLSAAAVAFALLGRLPFAGGLLIGLVLGAVPALSWAWISSRGLESRRNRVLAAVLAAGKLFFYSGVLWLVVARPVVDPVAVFLGVTGVVAVLSVGSLLAPPRPKEAA
jgi:hypothetical protein